MVFKPESSGKSTLKFIKSELWQKEHPSVPTPAVPAKTPGLKVGVAGGSQALLSLHESTLRLKQ